MYLSVMCDTPARTGNLLETYSRSLTRRVDAALTNDLGVRGAAAAVLVAVLNWAEGKSLEELRTPLGITQPAATRIVDRLVADGLVTRSRRPDDRREWVLGLSAAGRRRATQLVATRQSIVDQDVAALPDDARRALTDVLEILLTGLTTGRVSARSICQFCDANVCGHPVGCPVTAAANDAEAARCAAEEAPA
jgi:MarR family transcriptional regulator, negative regulator of the multidrug operon emrRAB